MLVSYLISTWNRKEILRRHLGRLDEQTYQGPLEVIVCVDGSTDGTQEMLATWPENPRYTLQWFDTGSVNLNTAAKSRNNGVRAAKGDLIIFVDDDCLPHCGLIWAFFKFHKPNRIQLGYKSSIKAYLDMPLPVPIEPGNMTIWAEAWKHGRFRFFQTGNCAMSQEASRFPAKDGNQGFDERFVGYGHEDTEFGQRLYRAGHEPFFNPDAIVWHVNDGSSPQQQREQKIREAQESGIRLQTINRE